MIKNPSIATESNSSKWDVSPQCFCRFSCKYVRSMLYSWVEWEEALWEWSVLIINTHPRVEPVALHPQSIASALAISTPSLCVFFCGYRVLFTTNISVILPCSYYKIIDAVTRCFSAKNLANNSNKYISSCQLIFDILCLSFGKRW